MAQNQARTDKNDTEIDTEAGGEAHLICTQDKNIYLMNSYEEVILDFVKDHKQLYDKTNEHFKDKARKECLWER